MAVVKLYEIWTDGAQTWTGEDRLTALKEFEAGVAAGGFANDLVLKEIKIIGNVKQGVQVVTKPRGPREKKAKGSKEGKNKG